MKEKYEDIACEVVMFEKADVITTSDPNSGNVKDVYHELPPY